MTEDEARKAVANIPGIHVRTYRHHRYETWCFMAVFNSPPTKFRRYCGKDLNKAVETMNWLREKYAKRRSTPRKFNTKLEASILASSREMT